MLIQSSLGVCDVTKKDDIDRIFKQVQKKEKYINLLGMASGLVLIFLAMNGN